MNMYVKKYNIKNIIIKGESMIVNEKLTDKNLESLVLYTNLLFFH